MALQKTVVPFGLIWCACIASTLFAQDVDLDEEQGNSRFATGTVFRTSNNAHVVNHIAATASDGRSEVSWKGLLESQAAGDYRLAAKFVGHLRISVRGQVVLDQVAEEPTWASSETIPLEYDWHELQISLKATADQTPVSLTVFWSGPGFRFEPIPPKLLRHGRTEIIDPQTTRGRDLVRVFRCEACHDLRQSHSNTPLRSPDLTHAHENLRTEWLRQFLSADQKSQELEAVPAAWQRVHGRFNEHEVDQIMAFLSSLSNSTSQNVISTPGDTAKGRELCLTLGCLACHKSENLGNDNMFGGGDLTHLSSKRPAIFFRRWLADPASINANHRMPVFDLSADELSNLSSYLSGKAERPRERREQILEAVERGRQLVIEHRCTSCHESESLSDANALIPIGPSANWTKSCLQSNREPQPDYGLSEQSDREAIEQYVNDARRLESLSQSQQLIQENGCTSCHARDSLPGLLPTIQHVAERHASLVSELPRLRPPSLNSVGDKLRDAVLRRSITRDEPKHRTWLRVRMPKFPITDSQVDMIANYFIATDRVPDEAIADTHNWLLADALQGIDRLVTSDGFGCTSCHAVGKVRPPESTSLNQLGPSLSGLGQRIRKTWFDRWVRNPARIVPRMEMPSVQVALPGLLDGDLERQLTAVWQLLNAKGFNPPDPNPSRVAFRTGKANEPAIVLTDVLRLGNKQLIKPFLIGLPNRHNVLLDLDQGRLAGWWMGDTAKQRTQGKSWFWEAPLFGVKAAPEGSEFLLLRENDQIEPVRVGQFVTEADWWARKRGGVELGHRLRFQLPGSSAPHTIHITQSFVAMDGGWKRRIRARGLAPDDIIAIRAAGLESSTSATDQSGLLRLRAEKAAGDAVLELEYSSADEVVPHSQIAQDGIKSATRRLDVMPGFRVQRLPLRSDVMPTALAWKPTGELVVASLKGRVWEAKDTDGDQLEDSLRVISDDLAAPYGLSTGDGFVDVLNKYGIIRLHDANGDGQTGRHEVVASGWGHTADYHDWVVGLPKDSMGNYFVAVPCQQDDRSEAAAHLRGKVLRLAPRQQTHNDPRLFQLEILTGGHRFPMGIARNRRGELFVTDNQGNYNPFNELNHVVKESQYGFINKLDRTLGFAPKLTPPAIDIPHPWTRSVNGICFLETPQGIQQRLYGPFEGHLIGCEYDTRRLIRMSIEEVDGWFQGAAYPLTEVAADPEGGLQGPINCAVAPDGDIYIANIRDSGWGGANNTGSLVRIIPELRSLPPGISQITATPTGFQIEFTRPVDRSLATDPARYAISSYRRVSTPSYGGDDVDRRTERVAGIKLAADAMAVKIVVESLRLGFVYEFHLKSLVKGEQQPFFPGEAFYTLRRLPRK